MALVVVVEKLTSLSYDSLGRPKRLAPNQLRRVPTIDRGATVSNTVVPIRPNPSNNIGPKYKTPISREDISALKMITPVARLFMMYERDFVFSKVGLAATTPTDTMSEQHNRQ